MTPQQIKLIHIAAKQIGLDDRTYRLLLHNVAGVTTCKKLDNPGLENVMAVFEDLGFRDAEHDPKYWRTKVKLRGSNAGERMVHLIRQLSERLRHYKLSGLCMRFSYDRTAAPEKLTPKEAWNLIEMLKAAITRTRTTGVSPVDVLSPYCSEQRSAHDAIPF
jgi:hypothetical protein